MRYGETYAARRRAMDAVLARAGGALTPREMSLVQMTLTLLAAEFCENGLPGEKPPYGEDWANARRADGSLVVPGSEP
jgi:hypothetical protein